MFHITEHMGKNKTGGGGKELIIQKHFKEPVGYLSPQYSDKYFCQITSRVTEAVKETKWGYFVVTAFHCP